MSFNNYICYKMYNLNLEKNIQSTAKKVLFVESKAIQQVAELINGQFEKIVSLIHQSKGRLVISGIGKSAIIAQKIVATMNSTGTPSLFMHAADAIHGDLGMIKADDMVMILSKSGNSPEIKVLVPLIRQLGNPIIGMTCKISSYLGQQADYILDTTIEEEACPMNLAPTTSTTVQMAMGDALAVSLIEKRGFTADDFARYHPGGSLGKQLYLKVEEVAMSHELPKVDSSAPLKDVIVEISAKRLGATTVLEHNNLVGIITDGDIRRILEKTTDLSNLKAKDIMTPNPATIPSNMYAASAMQLMKEKKITQLILVDKYEEVRGIIHMHDLLREGLI